MNKILVLILAPAVILTIVGRLDASEPPAGTQVDCWSLVGTSWKGEAKQGADEIELLISFRRIDLKSGTALGVLLEFPTASEDKQRQLKAFFGKHQQFSKSWHKADKAKPYQYALTIVKSEFIPGIPVNCMVIGSRGRFGLQQLCPYVSWSAYGRAQIEREWQQAVHYARKMAGIRISLSSSQEPGNGRRRAS